MSTELPAIPPLGQLATALAKAQGQMAGAMKDSINPHFKAKYADLASIWEACRGPLSANELAVLQPVRADGPRVTVTTILAHSSGEIFASPLTLTATQDTPQAIGSAITYGRRYGLAAMVGIAPEDDDGHAATHGNGQRGYTVESPAAPAVTPPQPAVQAPSEPYGGDTAASLPEGAILIRKVDGPNGKAKGFLHPHTSQPGDKGYAIYDERLMDLATQCCQDRTPVRPTFKTSKAGYQYVTALERIAAGPLPWVTLGELLAEPDEITADDIPF